MRFLMIVALAVLSSAPLAAQTAGGAADAEAEVLAVVQRLFDGMRAGDSTLVRGEDGWRIFHIADTRRREGCEPPPE